MQSTAIPGDLAGMPPGPELAAALGRVELAGVPNDEMLVAGAVRGRGISSGPVLDAPGLRRRA